MRATEKREWFQLWLDLRQRLFKICRESKDGYARVRGKAIWARPHGMTFKKEDLAERKIGIPWEETQINGMRKAHSWDWVPNIPRAPLEKLAECAE
jgi:hypothetical protein